ncbi:MAG: RNA methyltransferase [Nitrospirota bacterium]
MGHWKDNIYFILVEPKESGNIGAAARALKNTGFKNLCLVKPPSRITDEARWLACNALDVLESAQIFNDLKDAINDKSIVVGTTRRTGKRRGLIVPVEAETGKIFEAAAHNNKIAILFGRESRGLFNKEVDECGFLLTIPGSKDQPSFNLAQAVLIVAYELSKTEHRTPDRGTESIRLTKHGDISSLYARIADTLKLLDYIPRGNRNLETRIMRNLKHFIGRAGLTDWELKMLHGICSQIGKKIKDGEGENFVPIEVLRKMMK